MERLIRFNGGMHSDIFMPTWNPAFGKSFTSKGQIKEEIKRIAGEEGREIVEVGNEKVKAKREKTELVDDRVKHEFRKLWRNRN